MFLFRCLLAYRFPLYNGGVLPMIKIFFRLSVLWAMTFIVALSLSAFALPWFFQWYETVSGVPLPFEGVLRFTIIAVFTMLLVGSLVWLLMNGGRRHWLLWWIQGISFVSLLFIFFGDRTYRLMEEYSWIRYTTSGFLFLAACAAVYVANLYRSDGKEKRFLAVFWLLIGGAFAYAAFDELLQIHEALGNFIATNGGFPSYVTDLVTMGYAVVALAVLAVFFRSFLVEYRARQLFSATFVFGGIVYFLSTIFDTIDFFVLEKLRILANALSTPASFIFGDGWAMLWAVRNFFNGMEEVFEHTAASLFFSALLILILEKRMWWTHGVAMHTPRRKIAAQSIGVIFIVALFGSIGFSLPLVFPSRVPLDTSFSTTRIAGYFDGLSHTDDLFYHPAWGVLVANEGKGNVYQWKDGQWGMVPDPKKVLRDTDSVTADAEHIYVSDGVQGTIFQSNGRGQWEALWTKNDGLQQPEGIVAVQGMLYVIDESENTITKLVRGKKPDVWKPSHPLWKAPEGIAYDATTKTLVVTDDVTGAVFRVDFGKSVTPIARLQHPEDVVVLSDGNILVTDNGWGAVFTITPSGKTEKLLQFRRPYRDVQGVTVDDTGRVYVVTADGFDRVSFMPSMLFRFTKQ